METKEYKPHRQIDGWKTQSAIKMAIWISRPPFQHGEWLPTAVNLHLNHKLPGLLCRIYLVFGVFSDIKMEIKPIVQSKF